MATTPQPPPLQPNPPATVRKSALGWVLGVIIGLLVLLIGTGAYFAYRIAKSAKISQNRIEIQTPAGELNIQTAADVQVSLPVYPGAWRDEQGARVLVLPREEEGVDIRSVSYRTDHPVEKVRDWYRQHLDSRFRLEKGRAEVRVDHSRFGPADFSFVAKQGGRTQVVSLERVGTGTRIELVEIGKRQPL